MNQVPKRKIGEIIQLYLLEPNLRDVYVEGLSDSIIIESFFKKNGISDVKIYSIELIDFKELFESNPELIKNNKAKVIRLSELLQIKLTNKLKFISCIIDKDFDHLLGKNYSNDYLFLTDHTCFEMYVFDPVCIDDFYRKMFHTFPFDGAHTLSILNDPLKELFLIRYAFVCLHNEKYNFIEPSRTCEVCKKSGRIKFDSEEYLARMLNKHRLYTKKNLFKDHIYKSRRLLPAERRLQIRGHDFIHLFYHFVNRIKNDIRINEPTLARALYAFINYDQISKYTLFSSLLKKYS